MSANSQMTSCGTIEPCGSPRTLAVTGTSVAAVTTNGTRALGACPSAVRPCVCGGWFGGLWEELLPIVLKSTPTKKWLAAARRSGLLFCSVLLASQLCSLVVVCRLMCCLCATRVPPRRGRRAPSQLPLFTLPHIFAHLATTHCLRCRRLHWMLAPARAP